MVNILTVINDCYDVNLWSSQKKLRNDAIPSIFDFPAHLKKINKNLKNFLPTNKQNIILNTTNDSVQ